MLSFCAEEFSFDKLRDHLLFAPKSWRRRPVKLEVRFAEQEEVIQTLEGPIPCQPGDAVVRGTKGETWPIRRETFGQIYSAIQGVTFGDNGIYSRIPLDVCAAQVGVNCEILRRGGGRMKAEPGDWIIERGAGQLSVVKNELFDSLYEPA